MTDHTGNILTLWEKAWPPEMIPEYPGYEMAVAKGGEITYEIDQDRSVFRKDLFTSQVIIRSRAAEPGEMLRDSVLKYIANWDKNMEFRGLILEQAEENSEFQELQSIFAKSSILYFTNVFCWTFDDRLPIDRTIPFVTYPFQDDVLTWTLWLIFNGLSGVEEKSRDMGASWMEAVIVVYLGIFYPCMNSKMMSMREDDVDDRTADSLIGKVRFVLKNLPIWMRGNWVERGTGVDVKMAVTIPDSGSNIKGILSKGTAGRSGRTAYNANDEWAFVEDSGEVLKALSELSNAKKFLSSANGAGNQMYVMRKNPSTLLKTLHWTLHPLKNNEWAIARKARSDVSEETWASEQEISYETSTKGRVYPEFISFQSSEYDWCHVQDGEFFSYDPNYDVYLWLDFGMADPTSAVFVQVKGPPQHFESDASETCVIFDHEEHANKDVDWWAGLFRERGYIYREIVGDYRSGNQRDPRMGTWISYLGQRGFAVQGRYNTEDAPILEVKRLLNGGVKNHDRRVPLLAVNSKTAPLVVKGFQNWAYPTEIGDDGINRVKTGSKPKHDQWSHAMKAVAYGVDWRYGRDRKETPQNSDWDFRVMNQGGNL